MDDLRIALLPGSIRRDSVHRRLAQTLEPIIAARGVNVDLIDLGEYPMPMYHGDDEATTGQPEAAVELAGRLAEADGLVILTPEYNGGPSALLKNAIDWVTRVDRGALRHLLIGLAAASPGPRGAVHGLSIMRQMAEHMRLDVQPETLSIPNSGDAFGAGDQRFELVRPDAIVDADRFVNAMIEALRRRSVAAEVSTVA